MQKTKNLYFSNLDIKKVKNNRPFSKIVVPFFTNKPLKRENIIINEGDNSISDKEIVSNIQHIFLMLC